MLRYVNGAPFSTDLTTTLKYDDKINFGLGAKDNKNYQTFFQNLVMPFKNIFRR